MAPGDSPMLDDAATNSWYAGWCRVVPGEGSSSYLHVSARLSGSPDQADTLIEPVRGLPGPGGEGATVDWPAEPPFLEAGLEYQPLAFQVERSSFHGVDTPGVRWFRLKKDSAGLWLLQRFGSLVLSGTDPEQPIQCRVKPYGPIFFKHHERLIGPWKNIAEREGEIRLIPMNEEPSCLLGWMLSKLHVAPVQVEIAKEKVLLLPFPPPVEQAEVFVDGDSPWKPLEEAVLNSSAFTKLLADRIEEEVRKRAFEVAAQADEMSVALLQNADKEVAALSSRADALREEVAELESQSTRLRASLPLRHIHRSWPKTQAQAKNLKHWIERSLTSCLGWHIPSASADDAEELAAAILGCQCVVLPDPGYALAFCEASGGTAELLLVPVEPHWIKWQDCWTPDVAGFWRAATENPKSLYILHFQDLDRSLASLWGRPFWNLACGLSDALPDSRFRGWPSNLRLSSSMAQDEACLPLTNTLLQYFGATLPRTGSPSLAAVRPSPLQLPAGCWTASFDPQEFHEDVIDFGCAARQATIEIGRLEQLYVECGHSAHEAGRRACRVRVAAPRRLVHQERSGAH